MLKMNNITKTFNSGTVDERVALDHLTLTLHDGDFVTVIGGNGAGKSTMQNAICGTWRPDEGSIELDGVNVSAMPEYKRARYLGRVYQDPMMGTSAGMQIEENLALAERRGRRHTLRPGIRRGLPPPPAGAGTGAGGPPHHQGGHPLRRPAAGPDPADGHAAAAQAAAAG